MICLAVLHTIRVRALKSGRPQLTSAHGGFVGLTTET